MTKVKVMRIAHVAPHFWRKKFCQITGIYYVYVTLKKKKIKKKQNPNRPSLLLSFHPIGFGLSIWLG